MILRMWSTNPDGVILGEDVVLRVFSLEHATSVLVAELFETASENFLHNALKEWLSTGRIDKLSETSNDTAFWNVELLDD